jgi:hypothetical protein
MPRPRPTPRAILLPTRAILSPSLSPGPVFVVWLAPVSETVFAVGSVTVVGCIIVVGSVIVAKAGAEVERGTGNVSYNLAGPISSIRYF